MDKRVIILWTGGWDSTFRLLQLAEYEISIQPVYVRDKGRKGREYEEAAMKDILEMVRSNTRFKAKIADIKYYDKEWIMENCRDEQISKDYKYLRKKYHIGSQYEWLALLCKYEGIKVETGVVSTLCPVHGRISDAIIAEGKFEPIEDDFLEGRVCIAQDTPGGSASAISNLLGNFIFTLTDITKEDIEHIAKEKGWMDIMNLTWFCHSPIKGKPCGFCNPCDDAMKGGMEWRLSPEAQKRHKHRKINRYMYLVKKHLGVLKN